MRPGLCPFCGCCAAESTLNEARGGESDCRLVLPVTTRPWVAMGRPSVSSWGVGAPSNGCVSAEECRPEITLLKLRPEPTCRSVKGFAVAAAWLRYSLYRLYGVAAPGLESLDLQGQTQQVSPLW